MIGLVALDLVLRIVLTRVMDVALVLHVDIAGVLHNRRSCPCLRVPCYSHSIVAGGFELTSYTTRFTPSTSLMMRLEMWASTSGGNGNQSAVMPSELVTARSATTLSYVRASPITPTLRTGSKTANACQMSL